MGTTTLNVTKIVLLSFLPTSLDRNDIVSAFLYLLIPGSAYQWRSYLFSWRMPPGAMPVEGRAAAWRWVVQAAFGPLLRPYYSKMECLQMLEAWQGLRRG